MPRFYLPQLISGNTVSITDEEQLHHMRRVLRLRTGDQVTVFDLNGNEYLCSIETYGHDEVILRIQNRSPARIKRFELTIACAVPKKSLMDDIVDKLTQLGVDVIIPLETERGIVRLEENAESRRERWQKIARSAAEQSRRNRLPEISRVMSLKEIISRASEYDMKLIPTLSGPSQPINLVLAGQKPAKLLALIGPEGDFTFQEIEQALRAGCVPVSLGDTTLRVETAAVALAAYLELALLG